MFKFALQCNMKRCDYIQQIKRLTFLFIVSSIYIIISINSLHHHFKISFTQVWKYILETFHNDHYWQWIYEVGIIIDNNINNNNDNNNDNNSNNNNA